MQVSGRHFGARNAGGTDTDILSSPFRTRGVSGVPAGRFYGAPYLDSTDPEDRNNRQATGSLNWMLTSSSTGTHDVKAGFENYASRYVGGNSQTATGYVFRADYALAGGRPGARRAGPRDAGLPARRDAPRELAAAAAAPCWKSRPTRSTSTTAGRPGRG